MSDPLTTTLIDLGMRPVVAEQLVGRRREDVERQLAWWPFRDPCQHPGAVLRRAIEESWAPPARVRVGERRRKCRYRIQRRKSGRGSITGENGPTAGEGSADCSRAPQ